MLEYIYKIEDLYESLQKDEASAAAPAGKGVPASYKKIANSSVNVMWRAKVKGHKVLDGNIPLHTTLKTFDKPDEAPLDEVKQKVAELGIERPDPSGLKFEAVTHVSPRTGQTYYMLKMHGTHPAYDAFHEHFKGRGITYEKFMPHITINKEIYDQIKKEGIQPHEVEFSPLLVEHGADNATHIFPDSQSHKDHQDDITPKHLVQKPQKLAASEKLDQDLEKGIRESAAALGVVAALAGATPVKDASTAMRPPAAQTQAPANDYSPKRMLAAISNVESTGGKFVNHRTLGGMHQGESAFGKYGLTPVIIRETINMHRDLKQQHKKALGLKGTDLHHYMQDNPGLEDEIASRHLSRLEHHFGQNPAEIGHAWLQGITGTHKAKKENADIHNHWHVKKIKDAYSKGV